MYTDIRGKLARSLGLNHMVIADIDPPPHYKDSRAWWLNYISRKLWFYNPYIVLWRQSEWQVDSSDIKNDLAAFQTILRDLLRDVTEIAGRSEICESRCTTYSLI
jgi:hypothetical protein